MLRFARRRIPWFVTLDNTQKLRHLDADPHVNLSYYKDRTFPDSPTAVVRRAPVSSSTTVTCAPGTAAPDMSVMRPVRVAPVCARTGEATMRATGKNVVRCARTRTESRARHLPEKGSDDPPAI
jgi:hypothetical protein